MQNINSRQEFIEKIMERVGAAPDTDVLVPGEMVRFSTNGRSSDKAGWAVIFEDEKGGAFGCWRQGISEVWHAGKPSSESGKTVYSPKVKKAMKPVTRQVEQCRANAAEIWEAASLASEQHPYIRSKGIKPFGIRQSRGSLLVPVRDISGNLTGIQFIDQEGRKKFLQGTVATGCFHTLGEIDGRILVVEGYATGATIHDITGECVVVAFSARNLKPVAEALRAQYPMDDIFICADDDHATPGNPGLRYAADAAEAVQGQLAIPQFPEFRGDKDTDFNDLARLSGAVEVFRCLGEARSPIMAAQSADKNGACCKSPVKYRRMTDITSRPILWLWEGRFAIGKFGMLAGNPGLGKSQLTAFMAATVSTGGNWPVDGTPCVRGNVIILNAEDDAEDTIKPRLEAAGADMTRIYLLDAVYDNTGGQRAFNLKDDIVRLEQMILEIGGAALIIIDPISAYLGGVDSHKNADVRSLLTPLSDLASKHYVAAVGVSHLAKSGSKEMLLRVMGSLAFVAAPRCAWAVIRDPDDASRRLMLPLKNNIADDQTGLAFRIAAMSLPGGIGTSCVDWEDEYVTITADEASLNKDESIDSSAIEGAQAFLLELLSSGPVASLEVKEAAQYEGFSWRTIQRAQKKLGILSSKAGMAGGWMWSLPEKDAK